MSQLYLNKLLRTSSEGASHLHLLLLMPQNTGYLVNSPYGTGKKKYYTIHKHRIYTNVKKKLPQFEKHVSCWKVFPSSQDPLCVSLLKI